MNIIKLKSVDSTNAYVKRELNNLHNFDVVYSLKQTKGKGRNTHTWNSEANKNLLCSVLIKNRALINKGPILSLYTALAVLKTLKKLKLDNIKIKWPNDIYIKDKKICGILLESKSIENSIQGIVVGIGLNLNQTKFNKTYNATSYKLETKSNINVEIVLNVLIKEMESVLSSKSNLINFINKYNYLKNKQVKITINKNKVIGLAKNIDNQGNLLVVYKDKIYKINSDEVSVIF